MHVAYRRYISVDGKFVVDVEGRVSFVFFLVGVALGLCLPSRPVWLDVWALREGLLRIEIHLLILTMLVERSSQLSDASAAASRCSCS